MSKKTNNLIEKSNKLNTLKSIDMSLTEFRFFCLYLSKINGRDLNTRTACIDINEFEEIFEVKINTSRFNQKIKQIMSRTVEVFENDEYIIRTLYSEFRWKKNDPKVLQVTCNDMMLPYLFELKKNYTTYTIGNIAKLNSVPKIRLYEIAKQYTKIENVKLTLEELQDMMCTQVKTDFAHFNRDTLKPAIKDINQYTDIEVSYSKILNCRRVVALILHIKSKNSKSSIMLETANLIAEQPDNTNIIKDKLQEKLQSVYLKLGKAYTMEQLYILYNIIDSSGISNITPERYIITTYYLIKAQSTNINNLYKYTLSVLEQKISEKSLSQNSESLKIRETSYDLEEYKDFISTTKRNMGG